MPLEELRTAVAAVQQKIAELESRLAPVTPGVELTEINKSLRKLTESGTQEQILETYLQEAQSLAGRGVLFRREKEHYVPWKALGFQLQQVPSVEAREMENPIVQAAENKQIVILSQNPLQMFPWLQHAGGSPQIVACVPLTFGETTPVVLYLDSSEPLAADSLELLTQMAILVLKNETLHRSGFGDNAPEGIHQISEAPPLGSDLPRTNLVIENDSKSTDRE